MKILVVGGTGLLGTHAVREALRRGHRVTVLSRGRVTPSDDLAGSVERRTGDVHAFDPSALEALLVGHDAVVYALGLDERQLHRRPAYGLLHDDHVTTCLRVLDAAQRAGVQRFVVYGSYFTYFDQQLPDLGLSEKNVYVRTRKEQKEAVLARSAKNFQTFVFELPYIVGSLPGQFPPWTFLFSLLGGGKKPVFFFGRGGTAVVTATQVAQATLGALEHAPGKAYPLSGGNLTWSDFARNFFEVSGVNKKVVGIPKVAFVVFGVLDSLVLFLRNQERGLSLANYAELQFREAFVDPSLSRDALGFESVDCEAELKTMISEWIAFQRQG